MGTNGLSVYQHAPSALEFITQTGSMIAKSKLAGCKTMEQGQFFAMTCLSRGCDPLYLAQRYDVMPKSIRKKSVVMLADFRRIGGRHKVITRTPDRAEVELMFEGQTNRFSITWEEAEAEDFTSDSGGETKDNYSTPRKRMQMLWYRVVSDGVSVVCPEVLDDPIVLQRDHAGVDSPADDMPLSSPAVDSGSKPDDKPVINAGKAVVVTQPRKDPSIEDAEFVVKPETANRETVAANSQGKASVAESAVESATDPGESLEIACDDPCTPEQEKQIKGLIGELKQAGVADIAQKVKANLVKHGLEKLVDLTVTEADHLIDALKRKEVDVWIDSAITGHAKAGNE